MPHEVLRDKGAVRVYDVTANLKKARADGEEVFVFLSHQWLAYDNPDPEGVHFAAMTHAVGLAAAKAGVPLSKLRVWVDIVSIPQVNRSSQRLAVASLPTFASCCDLFIVVAPDATHHDTLLKCDSKTFRSRSWCRAEISACWARNGTENMFYATNSGLKLLAPNGALRPEALEVFSGGLTCCGLNHPDGMPCDKEALMLPMLGLFIEIYAQRGAKRDAWHRVAPRLDALSRGRAEIFRLGFGRRRLHGISTSWPRRRRDRKTSAEDHENLAGTPNTLNIRPARATAARASRRRCHCLET